jgi:hypothetical protein
MDSGSAWQSVAVLLLVMESVTGLQSELVTGLQSELVKESPLEWVKALQSEPAMGLRWDSAQPPYMCSQSSAIAS